VQAARGLADRISFAWHVTGDLSIVMQAASAEPATLAMDFPYVVHTAELAQQWNTTHSISALRSSPI
jgi:hypothetical protein